MKQAGRAAAHAAKYPSKPPLVDDFDIYGMAEEVFSSLTLDDWALDSHFKCTSQVLKECLFRCSEPEAFSRS